ncbi:cytochrome c oxidase subunit II [Gordonia phthalatica]|uniref:cytochrome-c oxidase n=1 Tax=Gordonia phthalatica TaxID=1136941 RepID=A0A0N9NA38_9ACTN|nr:cytochrome c oxidase subunit II [Gordonia phthalatica]ALG85184.1 cytochrome C oxidase subunit II [Gordonia phthalatica]
MIKRLSGLAVLGVGVLMTSGCSAEEALRFGWPEGITPEGQAMREFWTWAVIAALAMGVIVWGLIFWTITFHRRKKDTKPEDEIPRQTGYNVPLELAYTAIPFVLIAVMFYFTVIVQNKVETKVENPDVVVNVTAFQWNWKFGYNSATINGQKLVDPKTDSKKGTPFEGQIEKYREEDGKQEKVLGAAGGRSAEIRDYLSYDKIETIGTSSEIPILVLPTKTRIQFDLAAADVVHSFWVPEFLFKRDVMPFPEQNHQDPSFQISEIDREGAFVGRCAEMCGTFHAMMNFEIRAVSPQTFTSYINYRKAHPEATNAQALQAVCQTPESVTTVPFDTRRVSNGTTPKHLGDASNTTIANCKPEV